jgi:hypothetical protein
MSIMKLVWKPAAEDAFKELKKRATKAGKLAELMQAHNEMVLALRDPQMAFVKGELLFKTQKPGGEVRLFVNQVISVCYAAYRDEKTGWILKYKAVPDEWPQ